MWGGRYGDSSSGVLTATLDGPTTWQEHSFTMDGTVRTHQFSGSSFTGKLPAGVYTLYLTPNIESKQYVSAGQVYTNDY